MSASMRFAFGNGLVLLLAVLASGPLRADLFWKVAAQAPLAPQVSLILGDDQRTIAFGTGGTWEFDGTGWVKVRLLFEGKETLPGTPVFAGGRFFSVSHPSYGLRVHVLDGSTWRPFTQWPGFFPPHAFGVDRLYVSQGPFGACRNDGCDPDSRTPDIARTGARRFPQKQGFSTDFATVWRPWRSQKTWPDCS